MFSFHLLLRQKVEPKGAHDQSRSPSRTGPQHELPETGTAALIVDTYRTRYLKGPSRRMRLVAPTRSTEGLLPSVRLARSRQLLTELAGFFQGQTAQQFAEVMLLGRANELGERVAGRR